MDEHERSVRAARQVDMRIGFYIHFVIFLLVCAGLVVVNWLATPEIWWAEWPFLAWGIGVMGHALCAFSGGGPNFISRWRLRKIRELTHPEAGGRGSRQGGGVSKTLAIVLLGIVIGSAAGTGYMFTVLQEARENTRILEASRDALVRSSKEREERLTQLTGEKSSLERTVKDTEEQLRQLQTAKQSAEQAVQKARSDLAEAQSAREAAERALAEAKKGTAQ